MESVDVTSFVNPSFDADTIAKRTILRSELSNVFHNKHDGGDIELTASKSNPMYKVRSKKQLSTKQKKALSKKTVSTKKKNNKVSRKPTAAVREQNVNPEPLPEATTEVKIEIEIENDAYVTEHNDVVTGRRFSYNNATEETKWLDDEGAKELFADENGHRESEVKTDIENIPDVTEHNDVVTGRRFSFNNATEETKWLDNEDDIEVLADDNGRRYSYNNKTEVSTWLDGN